MGVAVMTLTIEPTEIAQTTIENVWYLLFNPANYSNWWDAETIAVVPEGHAHSGQVIHLQTKALGRQWEVEMNIVEVDEMNHCITLEVQIPLGVMIREIISCTPVSEVSCLIRYDSDIFFPVGLKGKLMKFFLSKSFESSIKDSLHRLKNASERSEYARQNTPLF